MKLPVSATRAVGSSKLFLNRNAPTILTFSGVAGFALTTALAIRATSKAQNTFSEIQKDVAETKAAVVNEEPLEQQKALVHTYLKSSVKLAELYWPVLVSGSASIVCVLAAHNMMAKRQASLVAAYTALDASYKAYRSRVREVVGEEKERELYQKGGWDLCTAVAEGTEAEHCDGVMPSPYSRFFDEFSCNWTKTPESNLMFLRAQQQWANDRLHAHGYIFLNEVYEALGLERSQAGQLVGWKLNGNGDGYVDFGLYSIGDESNRAFVNALEPVVLLDFNVDGPIAI